MTQDIHSRKFCKAACWRPAQGEWPIRPPTASAWDLTTHNGCSPKGGREGLLEGINMRDNSLSRILTDHCARS